MKLIPILLLMLFTAKDNLRFDFGNEKSLSVSQNIIEKFLEEISIRADFFSR
jgi:hypothetical protein